LGPMPRPNTPIDQGEENGRTIFCIWRGARSFRTMYSVYCSVDPADSIPCRSIYTVITWCILLGVAVGTPACGRGRFPVGFLNWFYLVKLIHLNCLLSGCRVRCGAIIGAIMWVVADVDAADANADADAMLMGQCPAPQLPMRLLLFPYVLFTKSVLTLQLCHAPTGTVVRRA
jgi:hypothetical protein